MVCIDAVYRLEGWNTASDDVCSKWCESIGFGVKHSSHRQLTQVIVGMKLHLDKFPDQGKLKPRAERTHVGVSAGSQKIYLDAKNRKSGEARCYGIRALAGW
jgi:hypothetical protein